MRAEELRIGNYLNYETAEGDILPTTIYWQDIKWISEDPKGFNLVHDPIPLTEEWLLKFGFVYFKEHGWFFENMNDMCINDNFELDWYEHAPLKYVHQLQNLYFALTEKELECQTT